MLLVLLLTLALGCGCGKNVTSRETLPPVNAPQPPDPPAK